MGVEVYVHDDEVTIDLTGSERVLAFKGHLSLPLADITSARVVPADQARAGLAWRRIAGAYWPGHIATGHFAVPDRPGARQLWCAYGDPELLEITTRIERPCRVVLQHPDRERLAWWISERIARSG
jgi:hypothetical protein